MMSGNSWRHDQSGRISIFFVLSSIAFIFLIALIYNTAYQTIRKIQMQGAADAAAIAGGAQAGRDLNDIANNNNTMTEILTVMIVVRSILQTVEFMSVEMHAASLFPPAAPVTKPLARTLDSVAKALKPIDEALSDPSRGKGWTAMRSLDKLNVGIKTNFSLYWAEKETRDFAERNGADRGLHGVLIARESPIPGPIPLPCLPLDRGRQVEFIDRAEDTYLKYVQPLPGPLVAVIGIIQPANPLAVFLNMIEFNKANLRGNRFTRMISSILNHVPLTTEPLNWPNDPPRPMLLTDNPSNPLIDCPLSTTEVEESAVDLSKVRRHLQYLAIATGKMSRGSKIGGENFLNVAPYQSLAYAEADVYNPTNWSMFEQNWRVKLAPSVALNEKFNQISGIMSVSSLPRSINGLSFVNNH